MRFLKRLFVILLLLALASSAHLAVVADGAVREGGDFTDLTKEMRLSDVGTAYYVSASAGDDNNDGLSEDAPWKSLSKLESMDLHPGDRVLLRRGDVWNERLTIRGMGREDAWIFVGAYGDLSLPKPEISLTNGKNDIGILATDISVGGKNGFGLHYVWIDNVRISNSFLGIYFRYDSSTDNKGIRVTNCSFANINCPELMREAMTGVDFLMQPKGNLEDLQGGRVVGGAGGVAEYIWPTAINVGGRPPLPLADVAVPGRAAPATAVSEIELLQNEFDSCVVAVGANCYNYHYGTGPNQCYTYTTDWNVRGLTATNTMTLINVDSADFGYDGTADSRWGRWSNLQAKSGMKDFTMSFGTTQALFSCCRNLYISNSSFNDCRNNGQADGCGFDFERAVHHFTLDSCVIANNEGQGVLVMQTTMQNQVTGETVCTPNTNNKIVNCLFYNNMRSVFNENYRYDVTVFNPNNTSFLIMNNVFYFREKTAGGAEVDVNAKWNGKYSPFGPEREGIGAKNNEMICLNRLPTLEKVLEERGMQASVKELLPVDKTWHHYTDEGATALEQTTESIPAETESLENESLENESLENESESLFAETVTADAESGIDGNGRKRGCQSAADVTALTVATACAVAASTFAKKKKNEN